LSKESNILTKYTSFIGINSKTAEKIIPDSVPNDEPLEEMAYQLENGSWHAPRAARKIRFLASKAPRRGAPSAPGRMMPTRDRKPTPSAFKRLDKKIAQKGNQKHMKLISISNSNGTWTNSKTFWTCLAAFNPKLVKTAVMKVCSLI